MIKVNQETYARVIKMLLREPVTSHEIADETGLHIVTAQNLMRCFKKNKVVHVSAWDSDSMGRDCTPVYKLGKGKDFPRRRMTNAERQKRCRDKKNNLEKLMRK